MTRKTRQISAAATALTLVAVPAAAQISGCNVRMFEGYQWVTCYAGSTACTTIWDGDTLVRPIVCEKVLNPQT